MELPPEAPSGRSANQQLRVRALVNVDTGRYIEIIFKKCIEVYEEFCISDKRNFLLQSNSRSCRRSGLSIEFIDSSRSNQENGWTMHYRIICKITHA